MDEGRPGSGPSGVRVDPVSIGKMVESEVRCRGFVLLDVLRHGWDQAYSRISCEQEKAGENGSLRPFLSENSYDDDYADRTA